MIDKLCELVQHNQNLLGIRITYCKSCDWEVKVYHRIAFGENELIIGAQSCDLTRACTTVYLRTSEWLIERTQKVEQPTEKQLKYIKVISENLGINFTGTTKEDARQWLSVNVPKHNRYIQSMQDEYEANNSDLFNNWGDDG